ncbi:MAG: START domain-containing protein [Myxococcaceae bacterium]
MNALSALTLILLLAEPAEDKGWELAADRDGLKVYAREKKGTGVQEMTAKGLIDAPPEAVWKTIRDYEAYTKTMPYIRESRILEREGGDKVIYLYSIVSAPLVDWRDYVIKLVDESQWKDGQGFLKVTWSTSNDRAPKKPDGMVRVEINDGYWKLEPRENGTKTFATYYLFTDPGGSLPKWLVNRANGTAVPDVFSHVRKNAKNASK